MPTKRELESLQEQFGRYSIKQAKQHNAAYRARMTMKGFPHITIEKNPPAEDCGLHDEHGRYFTNGRWHDCLCRMLGREPLPKEIQAEFNNQSL